MELKDILTIIVSVVVAIFTYYQVSIAKANLRMELYKKRFNIYATAINFYHEMYSSKNDNELILMDKANAFNICYREALFLFPTNDPVNTNLHNMHLAIATILHLKNNHTDAAYEARIAYEKHLKELEINLKPYIQVAEKSFLKIF